MNVSANPIINLLLTLGVTALCIAVIYPIHQLALLWLYINPNPRHLPPDLTGEAVGWTVIGLLTGLIITVITETIVWQSPESFWEKYKALLLSGVVSLIIGTTLGIAFAIIQMDSVDGQAMTSRTLAGLGGATAGSLGTLAGIVLGTTLRRYVLSLYRLPGSEQNGLPHNAHNTQ